MPCGAPVMAFLMMLSASASGSRFPFTCTLVGSTIYEKLRKMSKLEAFGVEGRGVGLRIMSMTQADITEVP